jgi:hypothetical protein
MSDDDRPSTASEIAETLDAMDELEPFGNSCGTSVVYNPLDRSDPIRQASESGESDNRRGAEIIPETSQAGRGWKKG